MRTIALMVQQNYDKQSFLTFFLKNREKRKQERAEPTENAVSCEKMLLRHQLLFRDHLTGNIMFSQSYVLYVDKQKTL